MNSRHFTDRYHRTLNYLRVSLTDRCNLRCIYCLPEKGVPKLRHQDILTYEEILRLVRIAVGLGFDKVRLTGGEPLVRKGICDFIPKLAAIEGIQDISLTTNGVYLKDYLKEIRSGGIRRINISLDTLRSDRYESITGSDQLGRVLEAIEEARSMGFHPLKINMVVIKGLNDDEVLDFAKMSLMYPYHVRFIEYMPIGNFGSASSLHHVPSSEIKSRLRALGKLIPLTKTEMDGPSENFRLEGAAGKIGFISPMSHHFCQHCNRLRLTASGQLRPCLLSDLQEDLKGPMRTGATDQALADLFSKTALKKPHEHRLAASGGDPLSAQMCSIGG
jgi:cyclic pyranopterin phosphate synthase